VQPFDGFPGLLHGPFEGDTLLNRGKRAEERVELLEWDMSRKLTPQGINLSLQQARNLEEL
jgi:hypothetical protein